MLMHFRVVLEGTALGINDNMEIFRRKKGKKYVDEFRMSGNKVQEEAVPSTQLHRLAS